MSAATWRVELTAAARRELRALPRGAQVRIGPRLEALATDPRPAGVTKLAGAVETWRLRVGDYRVLYQVRDEVLLVLVVRIGHRREVYRRR